MRLIRSVFLTTLVLGSASPPAQAADADFLACEEIAKEQDRLGCFDAAVAKVKKQVLAGEAPAPAPMRPEADPQFFGVPTSQTSSDPLNAAVLKDDSSGVDRDNDGTVESISVDVVEWTYDTNDYLTVVLKNGQVWRQVDGRRIYLREKDANRARISRGTFGSFVMNLNDSNRSLTVHRLDRPAK
ncbi:MAG: hypothetical protein KBA31_21065 [Alphaproteobacteria bacterium]|nr:hypothetical protein [Alphaproteobacteria bacterium]